MSVALPKREGFTLVINPLSNPLIMALYDKKGELFREWELKGYASDSLVEELDKILKEFEIKRIIYANGPGSYMGIKLCYIALKTLELTKGIPFNGCSAFVFSRGNPIKAMGRLYFIKEKETIITQRFNEAIPQNFYMPNSLDNIELEPLNYPKYHIPSI